MLTTGSRFMHGTFVAVSTFAVCALLAAPTYAQKRVSSRGWTSGQTIQVGGRQHGSLSSGGSTQYSLQLSSRTALEIRADKVLDSGLDPLVRVVDSNNNEVGRDDDGGSGLNSLLAVTLDRGNYSVVVQAVSGSGDFVLAINELRVRSISLGNSASGALSSGGRDIYTLRVGRRLQYQISANKQTGSDLDPKVTVLGSGDSEVGSNDDGGEGNNALLLVWLDPGDYTIAVTAYGTTSGGYVLSVGEPDMVNVGELNMNGSVSGSFSRAAERHTYRFRMGSAGMVTLDYMKATGSNIDPEFQLMYAGGDVIESNDDGGEGLNSRISRHLSAGDYEVVVFSHNTNTGSYTLSASGPGGSQQTTTAYQAPTPAPAAARGNVITFDSADAGSFGSQANDDVERGVVMGSYGMKTNRNHYTAFSVGLGQFGDGTYQAKTVKMDGPERSGYGLAIRVNGNPDDPNLYVFEVNAEGRYRFRRRDEGDWRELIEWTGSDAITTGAFAENVLKIEADHETFTLYVNDERLRAVVDESFDQGYVGFLVTEDLHIMFDDLNVPLPAAERSRGNGRENGRGNSGGRGRSKGR